MQHIKNKLWDIDPGYLRLKQAIKTIIAIMLAMGLCAFSTPEAKLLAGIAAGLSIQGIKAVNFRARIITLTLFDILYSTSFLLGLLCRPYPHLVAIGFTLLAFFSFYIRRFGNQYNFPGLMLWMFFFMANVLPFKSSQSALNNFHGFLIGLLVAILVYLFIYPNRQRRLFVKNYNAFISRLIEGIILARNSISNPISQQLFTNLFTQHKDQLFKMTAFNKAIIESKIFVDEESEAQRLTLLQFSLAKDLTIIYEAYQSLLKEKTKLPNTTSKEICYELNKFIRVLSLFKIHYGLPFKLLIKNKKTAINSLKKRQIKPLSLKNDKEKSLIAVLNLTLGLRLFKNNIIKLLEESQ